MSDANGTTFGRFVVDDILGRGGMGVVYRAHDPVIGRSVAIKVLHIPGSDARDEVEARSRFEQEFKSAGTLSHPSLVTIYDVGEQDGKAYIAMECVEGESLDDVLRSGRELSFRQIADIAMQLCKGLDYAHAAGVVHRDIKPANILLTPEGRPKITDFGVAKVLSSNLTQTGTVVGTPSYMAPEQVTSQSVSGRTDQFAVGVILYQMVTGELPFSGDIPTTVLYRIVHEDPEPPQKLNAELPPTIDQALLRALAKKPGDRFPSCVALAEAIREALGATPQIPEESRQRTVTLSGQALPIGSGTYDGAMSWWQRQSGGPRLSVLAAGALLFAALGWFGVSTYLARNPDPGVPSSEAVTTGAAGPASEAEPTELGGEGQFSENASLQTGAGAAGGGDLDPGSGSEPTTSDLETPVASTSETFVIRSQPEGATVTVDGEALAEKTPVEVALETGRTYDIRVEKEGFVAQGSKDLAPEDRDSKTLSYDLRPVIVPGIVVVDAVYDTRVTVGGREYSGSRVELAPGNYRLEVRAPAVYYEQTHPVQVESGKRLEIALPSAVSLQLASVPENATVSIDGGTPLTAPTRLDIVPGPHRFRFEWPDGTRNEKLQAIGQGGGRLMADANRFSFSPN